jgi:hypothetical protein
VVGYTPAQFPPFSGEIGIDALTKPTFRLPPTQALTQQQISNAAAFDANPFARLCTFQIRMLSKDMGERRIFRDVGVLHDI